MRTASILQGFWMHALMHCMEGGSAKKLATWAVSIGCRGSELSLTDCIATCYNRGTSVATITFLTSGGWCVHMHQLMMICVHVTCRCITLKSWFISTNLKLQQNFGFLFCLVHTTLLILSKIRREGGSFSPLSRHLSTPLSTTKPCAICPQTRNLCSVR